MLCWISEIKFNGKIKLHIRYTHKSKMTDCNMSLIGNWCSFGYSVNYNHFWSTWCIQEPTKCIITFNKIYCKEIIQNGKKFKGVNMLSLIMIKDKLLPKPQWNNERHEHQINYCTVAGIFLLIHFVFSNLFLIKTSWNSIVFLTEEQTGGQANVRDPDLSWPQKIKPLIYIIHEDSRML